MDQTVLDIVRYICGTVITVVLIVSVNMHLSEYLWNLRRKG